MYRDTIGVLGGFGGYATLHFMERFLEVFASEKESNYTHIFFDNDFTMPSRTRALLYGERYEEIVREIAAGIRRFDESGVSYVILACGTAHVFLEDVYAVYPSARKLVMNIIDACGEELVDKKVRSAAVIAAEGTLKYKQYSKQWNGLDIEIEEPDESRYDEIRFFIEAVKQNNLNQGAADKFIRFLKGFKSRNIILGCTEFPQLVRFIHASGVDGLREYTFYNPLESVLWKLKATIK